MAEGIKSKIDENQRVQVHSIGPIAVFKAVDSISCAREITLEEGQDISFVPEFEEVTLESGGSSNRMNFSLLVEQV